MSTQAADAQAEAKNNDTPAWKALFRAFGNLCQKHVLSHIPPAETEAKPVDTIEIPVESLGSGLLGSVRNGLAPVALFGSYTIKGARFAARDSSELLMKGVSKARALASGKDKGCDDCTENCAETSGEMQTGPSDKR
jgi:hypothetical protein